MVWEYRSLICVFGTHASEIFLPRRHASDTIRRVSNTVGHIKVNKCTFGPAEQEISCVRTCLD
uniref:Uncharacterized protein n=1 Tax=Arundo donax TaxID=35708 RepID=A0A0A9H2Q8_ARUDO